MQIATLRQKPLATPLFLTASLYIGLLILGHLSDLNMTLANLAMWSVGTLAAVSIVIYKILRRQAFHLLTFLSLLFCLEISIGYLVSIYPGSVAIENQLELRLVTITLTVAVIAYLSTLLGYKLGGIVLSDLKMFRNARLRFLDGERRLMSRRYRVILLVMGYVLVTLRFFKPLQRISAAGGLAAFAETAMKWRVGTFAEGHSENAIVTLINMVSYPVMGFCGLGFYLIIRRYPRGVELVAWVFLLFLGFCIAISSLFRSVFISFFLMLIACYDLHRPLTPRKVMEVGLVMTLLLILFNFGHFLLFSITASWEQVSFLQSTQYLLAPQGHFITLGHVLDAYRSGVAELLGKGWMESAFFYVPRAFWPSKMANYALVVQEWAGLPDWYQQAPTYVGELIAQWGWFGLSGVVAYGFYFSAMDKLRFLSPEFAVAVVSLVLPRILVDVGMGFSAVSITVFGVVEFFLLIRFARWMSRIKIL